MISANHVDQEIPKLEAGKEATLSDVYNALRVTAKLLLNVRTNQVRIGEKMGVDFSDKKAPNKPSTERK